MNVPTEKSKLTLQVKKCIGLRRNFGGIERMEEIKLITEADIREYEAFVNKVCEKHITDICVAQKLHAFDPLIGMYTVKPDQYGRIRLPNAFTKKIGVGTKLYLTDNGSIEIWEVCVWDTLKKKAPHKEIKSDMYGRIRLPKAITKDSTGVDTPTIDTRKTMWLMGAFDHIEMWPVSDSDYYDTGEDVLILNEIFGI